jgi:arsenate reductase (thioredoxin)
VVTVIFVCVHNAGRSQMAAAFFNAAADAARARALSAGTEPATHVHPEVVAVMHEVGIDLSHALPARLTPELAAGADLLVTMGCGESCPVVPGLRRDDWALPDPKGQAFEQVRQIRDEIRARASRLEQRLGSGQKETRPPRWARERVKTMNQSQIETLDSAASTLTLSLDTGLYPRDVLYAAAYVFLDRAYVLLDRQGSRYLVHLRGKQAIDEAALRAMAGEFENELLAQALRQRVVKANQRIIEGITGLAIGGATIGMPPAEAVDDDMIDMQDPGEDGFLDDPLQIATPWEAKKGSAEE